MNFAALIRHPAGYLPLVMSLLALTIVCVHVLLHGPAREADEGAAAHLWQILMALQLPIVAFVAVRWIPTNARAALPVLALQTLAALAAMAPVYFLAL